MVGGLWGVIPVFAVLAASCVATVVGFRQYDTIASRFLAATPQECWGSDLVGTIMALNVSEADKAELLGQIPRAYWASKELGGLPAPALPK
jgi:hypothetical protein